MCFAAETCHEQALSFWTVDYISFFLSSTLYLFLYVVVVVSKLHITYYSILHYP